MASCSRQKDWGFLLLCAFLVLVMLPVYCMVPYLLQSCFKTWFPDEETKKKRIQSTKGDPNDKVSKINDSLIVITQLSGIFEMICRIGVLYGLHFFGTSNELTQYFYSWNALFFVTLWISIMALLFAKIWQVFKNTPLALTIYERNTALCLSCNIVISAIIFVAIELTQPSITSILGILRIIAGISSVTSVLSVFLLIHISFVSRLNSIIVNNEHRHGDGTVTNGKSVSPSSDSPKALPIPAPSSGGGDLSPASPAIETDLDLFMLGRSSAAVLGPLPLDLQPSEVVRTVSCFNEHSQEYLLLVAKHSVISLFMVVSIVLTLAAIVMFSFDKCYDAWTVTGNIILGIGTSLGCFSAGLCQLRFHYLYSTLCGGCHRYSKVISATYAHVKFLHQKSEKELELN